MEERPDLESAAESDPEYVPGYVPATAVVPEAEIAPHAVPSRAQARRERSRGGFAALLVAALLGGVIGAGALFGGLLLADRGLVTPRATDSDRASAPGTVTVVAAQPLEAVAAKVVPSVVNIVVETQDRFGTSSGVGSGVIIREDGYILTNNHVVDGASRLVVRLGSVDMTARVVGTDAASDLAVIKIERTGLPAATIGSSANLRVGEGVVAVGSPFGLDKTVTSGIVSALHRTNITQDSSGLTAYTNLIQTDAPINPGNSGGALADFSGAVVGINTLIYSATGQLGTSQSAGIGFAIPIDFAKSIADQLIAGKQISHPYLGVSAATVTPAIAEYYGLPEDSGALVQQVTPGSPAEAAGLRVGDIIVRFDDTVVRDSDDVFTAVAAATIGQAVQVEVARGSGHVTVEVTLGSDAGAE